VRVEGAANAVVTRANARRRHWSRRRAFYLFAYSGRPSVEKIVPYFTEENGFMAESTGSPSNSDNVRPPQRGLDGVYG